MNANPTIKIFKPRQSTGWVWVGVISLVLLAIGINLIIRTGFSGPFIVISLITVLLGIGFMFMAVFFPAMHYEIGSGRLTLVYGPLLRYSIDIGQIKSIRRCNLGFSAVSSFRFPGLALFSVSYPEVGVVKMCATSSSNGILLIETTTATYGLTPADEDTFVLELRNQMG